MNYLRHYNLLIDRARERKIVGYVERHHVVPRCMGGSDDDLNIVSLTAEEHFVAHQLLAKLFPSVAPLATVLVLMSKKVNSNKCYGWIRRRNAEVLKNMPVRNARISASLIGNKRAVALKGRKRPPFSPEWKAKITAVLLANPRPKTWRPSAESCAKMAISKRGNQNALGKKHPPVSQESREKMRAARYAYLART